ncbi:MAG: hypothetical protein PF590_05780 [Candidatus Delongbacteria bacterium]|jgi:flagellar basal body-associated protein FliL|nr:hypothetical protein [Candidatus Delongbacteria bacterium]
MILKLIILAIVFVGLSVVGLGVQVFFSKKKKFPATHIGANKNMRKLGIRCATAEEGGSCGAHRKIASGKHTK